MKQNYTICFIAISIICHIAYSMEDKWEQKAQDIKNLYNQASTLESNGQKTEALKLYIKITEEYFPSIPLTQHFQEIFTLKQNAIDKVNKLSKEKETIEKKSENTNDSNDIWPLAFFVAKITKFGK